MCDPAELYARPRHSELAAKGTVPSETSMRKWKAAFDAEKRAQEEEKALRQAQVQTPAQDAVLEGSKE